jgi:hypothetical protein
MPARCQAGREPARVSGWLPVGARQSVCPRIEERRPDWTLRRSWAFRYPQLGGAASPKRGIPDRLTPTQSKLAPWGAHVSRFSSLTASETATWMHSHLHGEGGAEEGCASRDGTGQGCAVEPAHSHTPQHRYRHHAHIASHPRPAPSRTRAREPRRGCRGRACYARSSASA